MIKIFTLYLKLFVRNLIINLILYFSVREDGRFYIWIVFIPDPYVNWKEVPNFFTWLDWSLQYITGLEKRCPGSFVWIIMCDMFVEIPVLHFLYLSFQNGRVWLIWSQFWKSTWASGEASCSYSETRFLAPHMNWTLDLKRFFLFQGYGICCIICKMFFWFGPLVSNSEGIS